jgi:hypothetical protein
MFTGLTAGYITTIGICALLRIVSNYASIIYGGVRVSQAFEMIRNCFVILSFVINSFILDHVPIVIANRTKFDQKSIIGTSEGRVMLVGGSSARIKRVKATTNHLTCRHSFNTIYLVH